MLTILISVAYRGAALIKGEALIYTLDAALITGRRLFEARRRLLEEIRYINYLPNVFLNVQIELCKVCMFLRC